MNNGTAITRCMKRGVVSSRSREDGSPAAWRKPSHRPEAPPIARGCPSAVLIVPDVVFDPSHYEERLRRGNLPPHMLWTGLPRRKRSSQ
jgi:hypothetical protein